MVRRRPTDLQRPSWLVEIYVRLYSKIIFGKSHYQGCKKYYRRCEVYYCHDGVFCPCCGMALRMSPTSKRDKERLRQLQIRRVTKNGSSITNYDCRNRRNSETLGKIGRASCRERV